MTAHEVTADTLNDVMEFGHVVTVHEGGRVTDGPRNRRAPELWMPVDEDGQDVEFGHVVTVHEDGRVTEDATHYAPELSMPVDEDGQDVDTNDEGLHATARAAGWELLTGWTGQHGYRGPVMHPSEFVGGGLACYVLDTPGHYVVVSVECYPAYEVDEDEADALDLEPAGWAIAYRAPDEDAAPEVTATP